MGLCELLPGAEAGGGRCWKSDQWCPEFSNSQHVLGMQAGAAGHQLSPDAKEGRSAREEKCGSMEQVLSDRGVLRIQVNWVGKP